MIHEYALDPELLSIWAGNDRDYAEFLREYGLGTPRIISSFPKKKLSKLRSSLLRTGPANTESQQGRRYIEMVTKLIEAIVLREVPDNCNGSWGEAAKIENERLPFGVVLSSESIETAKNITPDNMHAPDSIWNHPDQMTIQRTNEGFQSAISNLTRLATRRIVIIDTYGWTTEAIAFTQFLINSVSEDRLSSAIPSITLFYKEKRGSDKSGRGSPSAKHVKEQIVQGLDDDVSNIELHVAELREVAGNDVFHNRCILTEHGGVITGHGIGVSGEEEHTDEAILMRSAIYQKKWNQFIEGNCFEIVSQA